MLFGVGSWERKSLELLLYRIESACQSVNCIWKPEIVQASVWGWNCMNWKCAQWRRCLASLCQTFFNWKHPRLHTSFAHTSFKDSHCVFFSIYLPYIAFVTQWTSKNVGMWINSRYTPKPLTYTHSNL